MARRALCSAFVVTVSGLAACSGASKGTGDPPATGGVDETTVPAPVEVPVGGIFNPKDDEGRTILRSPEGKGCYVDVSTSPVPESEDVDCPALMSDPAFHDCVGGEITRLAEGCECEVNGNPPPAPRPVKCPKHP